MRDRDIDGNYIEKTNSNYISLRKKVDGQYNGYSSLVAFLGDNAKFIVNINGSDVCLADVGYKWLHFIPENENWCLTAIYDCNGNIIEWYFDITKSNFIDSNGDPHIDDLYIDVVLFPNGEVVTLDEDELKTALDNNEISYDDFRLAYIAYNKLIKSNILNIDFILPFSNSLLASYL